ncbi:sigma-70 family RNA polymerase sigma factor [Microbacterium sp. AZCO]|uniref:sigma-70 family RNA polymerase sigma factor n=1 Tax=Microbacterium sp. AZCO TaxID=3142976 RepID=UPI0031F43FF8
MEDDEARVLANLALAERVARRYFRHDPARDEDLVQVAYIGLMKASRRYEPSRGTDFAAYAIPTIAGELKRHLRDHGWFIRPPRHVQELRAQLVEAVPRMSQRLGRRPTLAELAVELGTSEADVREALESAMHMSPVSLDARVGEDHGTTLGEVIPTPGSEVERTEATLLVWAALRTLTPRDRRVVRLRYFDDCTQQDIATKVGVTQMQVSRILARTLRTLRTQLEGGSAVGEPRRSA